jgi:hypothetical protein
MCVYRHTVSFHRGTWVCMIDESRAWLDLRARKTCHVRGEMQCVVCDAPSAARAGCCHVIYVRSVTREAPEDRVWNWLADQTGVQLSWPSVPTVASAFQLRDGAESDETRRTAMLLHADHYQHTRRYENGWLRELLQQDRCSWRVSS